VTIQLKEESKTQRKKYTKVFIGAAVLIFIADSIGPFDITLPFGKVSMFPLIFAVLLGSLLGPNVLKIYTEDECKVASDMIMIVMAPYMVKMGIGAGHNLGAIVEMGPALILQEFGNLGTIIVALPVALLLGIKRESIGACYSINRDVNLGLTMDMCGPDAAETRGTFAVYITGAVLGTIFSSMMASVIASLNIFHPLSLGMAAGVGSTSMMAAMTGTFSGIYPQYAEQMTVLAGTSDMLSGVDGVLMGTFIGLPLTRWCYNKFEPKVAKLRKEPSEVLKSEKEKKKSEAASK
jgi:hypothetical protein